MFDFRVVTQWVDATLHQYLPASLVTTTEFVLVGVCLLVAYAVMALGLIYAERKVCAFFQCRLGPNRVGPFGMIQTVTDMIKMLIKEIIEINHVDRFLFNLAPYIVIIASLLAFSCIPFAKGLEIIDFNVGIFFGNRVGKSIGSGDQRCNSRVVNNSNGSLATQLFRNKICRLLSAHVIVGLKVTIHRSATGYRNIQCDNGNACVIDHLYLVARCLRVNRDDNDSVYLSGYIVFQLLCLFGQIAIGILRDQFDPQFICLFLHACFNVYIELEAPAPVGETNKQLLRICFFRFRFSCGLSRLRAACAQNQQC